MDVLPRVCVKSFGSLNNRRKQPFLNGQKGILATLLRATIFEVLMIQICSLVKVGNYSLLFYKGHFLCVKNLKTTLSLT